MGDEAPLPKRFTVDTGTATEDKSIMAKIINYCSETVKRTIYTEVIELDPADFKCDRLKFKLFNDPIHGSIQLNSLENAIINTPEYFRLKNIKQLGGACHVYPGATHTRFEHSIGVCYIAGEFVKHLNGKHTDLIDKQDEYCIRLAALCHDLGHGPFSHAFTEVGQAMNAKFLRHEDLSKLIFKKILLDHPVVLKHFVGFGLGEEHVMEIENMIDPPPKVPKETGADKEGHNNKIIINRPFLFEIVANKLSGVDVDKWDYFARDCHYLGVTNEFNWRRCMTLSSIVVDPDDNEQHIGFRSKELNNILNMFKIRCALHQKAYQHPVVNGIELIFKKVLDKAQNVPLIYTSAGIFISMKNAIDACCDTPADLSGYICLNDTIFDHISLFGITDQEMEEKELRKKELDEAKRLIERIMKRDTYVLVDEKFFPFSKDNSKKQFEKELDKEFKTLLKTNQLDKYDEEDWQIDLVTIKMASEKKDNPMEDIYFFTKEMEGQDMPTGERKKIKDISEVNLPRVFAEYRVRLYWKTRCDEKEQIKNLFVTWPLVEAKKKTIQLQLLNLRIANMN